MLRSITRMGRHKPGHDDVEEVHFPDAVRRERSECCTHFPLPRKRGEEKSALNPAARP